MSRLLASFWYACLAAPLLAGEMARYETRYYTIYTDLSPDDAREAGIRMTKMADEYRNRTRDFSGTIRQKMPFYLYQNADDFYALGAPRGSAGFFNGRELVALARDMGPRTWHIVQHEGFHQFARSAIGGTLPVWVSEGLAEYFGEAVFTGDGFVTGIIPQWRLERIRATLRSGQFRPLDEMMRLSPDEWNADLAIINYDQGWAMVQFLAHGQNGKYQRAFGSFVMELSRGQAWPTAWRNTIGDTRGFEQRWREYWSGLPDNPTAEVYARATTATLTSFLARAVAGGQTFERFKDFRQTAAARQLKAHADDWLPPALLAEALADADALVKSGASFEIIKAEWQRLPRLVCALGDGTRIVGKFAVRNGRAAGVQAEVVPAPTK